MKHAFLLMAHGNWSLLNILIQKLDHKDNDIFLHIDKKADFPNEVEEKLRRSVIYSNLFFCDRRKINWGGYSQIACELRLFEMALLRNKYRYFHIMSGVDFPIKPMSYIHRFFEENNGFQFVDIEPDELTDKTVWQFRYYHPLQEIVGRKGSRKYPSFFFEFYMLEVQRKLGVDRRKKNPDIQFKRGPNWVSVTDEFVEYMLSKKDWIRKTFGKTKCSDEMIVPTLVYNSPFAEKQKPCMRYIDWTRGNPYVFTIDEYDEILSSDALFVRKVSLEKETQKILVEKLMKL